MTQGGSPRTYRGHARGGYIAALVTQHLPTAPCSRKGTRATSATAKVSPWQGDTHGSDPTLGRAGGAGDLGLEATPGHRTGTSGAHPGDGAGPVSASGREQRSSGLGDESLENTSDGSREGKGQDRDTGAVLAPHLARGTGARGDRARLHRTRTSAQLLTKHLSPWGFCPPPSPHGPAQSPLPHISSPGNPCRIPAPGEPGGHSRTLEGPDQTRSDGATPEAKGGFGQGGAGPSWLSPWTLGGHSPLF